MARFRIEYTRRGMEELRRLRKTDEVAIMDTIRRHLADNPERVTGSSIKKLDPPLIADYRLRIGNHRAFCNVYVDRQVVVIEAIRFKGSLTLEEAADDQDH